MKLINKDNLSSMYFLRVLQLLLIYVTFHLLSIMAESKEQKGPSQQLDPIQGAIRARIASRGWVTRASNTLKTLVTDPKVDLTELQSAVDEFDERLSKFDCCQSDVEIYLDEDELLKDIDNTAQFRDNVRKYRVAATKLLRNTDETEASSHVSVTDKVKMPKLELPRFSGDPLKWKEFWEPFEATIDRSDMTDVSKFSYLKSLLDGEAKATVVGLTLTGAHYKEACRLLEGRYGRPELIIFSHVQELLQLSIPGKQAKVSALWDFYNRLQGHVRSLEALGVAGAQYGVVLTPVVLSRLPNDLRLEWAREGENKETDLQFLLSFLQGELKRRERSQTFSSNTSSGGADGADKRSAPPSAAALHTSTGKSHNNCTVCKKEGHPTSKCFKVTKIPLKDRKAVLQDAGCCFKCLSTSNRGNRHIFKKCRAVCSKCGGNHHVIICGADSKQNDQKSLMSDSHTKFTDSHTHTGESHTGGRKENCTQCGNRSDCPKESQGSSSLLHTGGLSQCNQSCLGSQNVPGCNANTNTGIRPSVVQHTGISCVTSRASVLLQTAKIKIVGNSGVTEAVVLFDTGSDKTYISEKLVNKINPEWLCSESVAYSAFGSSAPSRSEVRNVYNVNLDCNNGVLKSIVATEIPVICTPLFCPFVPQDVFAGLDGMVSVCAGKEVAVDMLIGLDNYWKLVTPEIVSLPDGLVAQRTLFGWIMSGCVNGNANLLSVSSHTMVCASFNNFSDKAVQSFWDLETFDGDPRPGADGVVPSADDQVLQQFKESLTFTGDRYQVSLPWKSSVAKSNLLDNYGLAKGRLRGLCNKLAKTPEIEQQYHDVFKDYLSQGFIEEVSASEVKTDNPVYYLPHRPVIKPSRSTTKVRPVFDASAKGYNGVSLNDCMEAGPCMIPNLPGILIRFRRWKVALCADITKAFLNIEVEPKDRDVHRFLWDDDSTIRVMRFVRVIFGNRSSPFLLNATVKCHLDQFDQSRVVNELSENLFVDDLLTGCDDDSEGCEMVVEADRVMKQAGFSFSKWASNSVIVGELLDRVFQDRSCGDDVMKVLGMLWVASDDCFRFDGVDIPQQPCITKRFILSCIARLFDPLGLLTPFVVTAKLMFQNLWRESVDWDVIVSESVQAQFLSWIEGLKVIRQWSVPRSYTGGRWDDIVAIQLHVFGDSSQVAYGAVVYLCFQLRDGSWQSSFVFSKAKVAPIRPVSLPRLELLAAMLGAKLLVFVRDALKLPSHVSYTCWSDSMVVLAWIKSNPSKWKPFVANRVVKIQDLTDLSQWKYCPGKENPADLVTRGLSAEELVSSSLWLHGPKFLVDNHVSCTDFVEPDCDLYLCEAAASTIMISVDDPHALVCFPFERWSSFTKAMRIFAWIFRFIHNARHSQRDRIFGELGLQEMSEAKVKLFQAVQRQEFIDYNRIAEGRSVGRTSCLSRLNPFLGTDGLLRVQGRLQFSGLPYDSMHPVILPKCHLSLLLVRYVHQCLKHAGVNAMLVHLRDNYWIISARRLCKQVKRSCMACKRFDAQAGVQSMAPLPGLRVRQAPAFSVTGLDHAGPLYCCDSGSKKYYILLFTCAVIRAVHLELVDSMSAESTMAAIRRFVSRRGLPSVIMSDNAKGFVAAKDLILSVYGSSAPVWRFSVPRAPWWGGFWERMVQTVKKALRRSVGKRSLTRVELETTIHEVESCVNSRPLTFVADDVESAAPLTPSHFLIGRASGLSSVRLCDSEDIPNVSSDDLSDRFICINQLLDQFWFSWTSDYIRNLPPAAGVHGDSLQAGSVVLVQDESCARLQWPLGVVKTVFPGKDGLVRSAEIRTAKGLLKRPVQKLYNLEVTDSVCDLGQTVRDILLPDSQIPATVGFKEATVTNKTKAAIGNDLSDEVNPSVRTRAGRLVKIPERLEL